nr:HRDC domain-containing protein [Acidithiobacillus sulfuriphilus]
MLRRRPQSLAALATIPGVGERKLEAYGASFLQVLREHG